MLFSFCTRSETLPDEPYIEYRSFNIIQDTASTDGKLTMYLQDGDCNMGLPPIEDTTLPIKYRYNFFMIAYQKNNDGTYSRLVNFMEDPPVELDTIKYRFSPLPTDAGMCPLKCTIDLKMVNSELSMYKTASPTGIVCFDVYVYDRSFTQSNIVRTPDINLNSL